MQLGTRITSMCIPQRVLVSTVPEHCGQTRPRPSPWWTRDYLCWQPRQSDQEQLSAPIPCSPPEQNTWKHTSNRTGKLIQIPCVHHSLKKNTHSPTFGLISCVVFTCETLRVATVKRELGHWCCFLPTSATANDSCLGSCKCSLQPTTLSAKWHTTPPCLTDWIWNEHELGGLCHTQAFATNLAWVFFNENTLKRALPLLQDVPHTLLFTRHTCTHAAKWSAPCY